MTREELIRRLRQIAREDGVTLETFKNRGKGSHIAVALGGKKTIVPYSHGRDLKKGTLNGIAKDLGIDPRRL